MPDLALVNIDEAKARLCALEEEALLALASPVQSHAFPRWVVGAAGFPYWKNRTGRWTSAVTTDDYGTEADVYTYTLIGRLVWAHLTAGYKGESDEQIDLAVPQVVEYIDAREKMQSAAYPASLLYLAQFGSVDGTGYFIFPPNASGTQDVGAEFTWRAEFVLPNIQAYLGG